MVTKQDFVRRCAAVSDGALTQREVSAAMEAMSIVLTEIVKERESVKLCNAVTISGVLKEAHTARNPATGGTVDVPEKTVPKAKFTPSFKVAINTLSDAAE